LELVTLIFIRRMEQLDFFFTCIAPIFLPDFKLADFYIISFKTDDSRSHKAIN